MASAHNDQTATLLEAMTEVVQKLEDSRLGVGPYWQELRAVDQKLITIRAIGNHSAPVNRIPAEILAQVFKYACTRPTARADSMPDLAALIAITHVCRRWRAVALSSATLWSHISLDQKSALAFAKRSQSALLTVTASVRGKKWERKMDLLRRLLPRVQTLRVKVTRIEDMRKLGDTLSSEHITSLTLQVNIKRGSNGHPQRPPHRPGNHPPILAGLFPGLRSLTIVAEYSWHIPVGTCPGLTSLRLVNNGYTGLDSTSISRLLSFLSDTPNLEDLDVRSSVLTHWDMPRESPYTASEPVCLSRLRQLRLIMDNVFALYSKLSVREDAMVSLVGVPSSLPTLDPQLQQGAFTAVELLHQSKHLRYRVRNAYRYIELCLPYHHEPFAGRNYPRYLSAVKTLSLTVSSRTFSDSQIWLDLLASLTHAPLLQTLYIRDVNTTTISHLVRILTHTDPAPAPCPQLRTLTLSLVSPSGYLADLKPLLCATEERARRGVPLESVTICSPRHRTLNPANVLFNFGGMHGLEWLLLCDRDLYHPPDSGADGYSDFCEKAVRKFRRRWVARVRENEGNDSDGGDIVDACT